MGVAAEAGMAEAVGAVDFTAGAVHFTAGAAVGLAAGVAGMAEATVAWPAWGTGGVAMH
jgi:hypothetical protein